MELASKILAKNEIGEILDKVRSQQKVSVFGYNLGERIIVANEWQGFLCYIVDTTENAELVAKDLQSMGRKVAMITDANDDFTYHIMEFGNSGIKKQASLMDMAINKVNACVITADVLGEHVAPKELFLNSALHINVGQDIDRAELMARLIERGYTRTESVESVGQCAARGDVLDIFPINSELPYRLHFFDTKIEKITSFNILTQYSIKEEKEVFICPNAFVLPKTQIDRLKQVLLEQFEINKSKSAKSKNPEEFIASLSNLKTVSQNLQNSISRTSWGYLSAYLETANILDFLPDNSIVIVDQPKQCATKLDEYLDRVSRNISEGINNGQLVPLHKNLVQDFDKIIQHLDKRDSLAFQSIMTQNRFFAPKVVFSRETSIVPKLGDSYEGFVGQLREYIQKDFTTGSYNYELYISPLLCNALQIKINLTNSTYFDELVKLYKPQDNNFIYTLQKIWYPTYFDKFRSLFPPFDTQIYFLGDGYIPVVDNTKIILSSTNNYTTWNDEERLEFIKKYINVFTDPSSTKDFLDLLGELIIESIENEL